jgi:uncharacterized protein (DUF302 family)
MDTMDTRFGYGKTSARNFEDTVTHVTQALQDEGFGILSDIDVAATLKKKLGAEIAPYRILGACNPPLARQAIEAEPSIGLLLPCNVVVRQDVNGAVLVDVMNTDAVLSLVDQPGIAGLARDVGQRLARVLAAV